MGVFSPLFLDGFGPFPVRSSSRRFDRCNSDEKKRQQYADMKALHVG